MRIIDEITQQEITNPDLSAGELSESRWARPEAYASIDNVTKFALDEIDYETVQIYHKWTPEELAEKEASEAEQDRQEIMDSLPDALAELSLAVSDGAADTADLAEALADLSLIVSNLVEGA